MSEDIAFVGPATKRAWPRGTTIISVALAVMVGTSCNDNQDYTIKFIIPNDYRGVIVIEQDKDHGVTPATKDGNVYVYKVSETGTLLVRSFGLFEHYHFTIARYADGRAIPTLTPGRKGPKIINPSEVALRSVGSQAKGKEQPKHFMCVGNLNDYRTCRRQYDFE